MTLALLANRSLSCVDMQRLGSWVKPCHDAYVVACVCGPRFAGLILWFVVSSFCLDRNNCQDDPHVPFSGYRKGSAPLG